MKSRVIILDKYDLVERGYLKDLININEKKTFRKAKLITNTYTFEVNNTDDFFSYNNPNSTLHGTNWRYSLIVAYNSDGNKIWEGIIIDIERNHQKKTAKIKCKNTFFKYRKDIVDYQSADWETGADAFKNICDSVGFEKLNVKAYTDSAARLEDADCLLKCVFDAEDGVKFIECIDKLAEYCNADLYVHNDELYFQHNAPFVGGVTITIEGDKKGEFRKAPVVSSPERDIINDYNIDYDESGDIPATDVNSNNTGLLSREKFGTHPLSAFRTGSNGQIIFKDKVSASYIGDSYIMETNKDYDTFPHPPQKNKFSTSADYRKLIVIGTIFRINFSEEGWVDKIFETFEYTVDEKNDEIKITSYEV